MSPIPPGFAIVQLSGPVIVTFLLESALFGILTIQLWLYYQAFPNDRRFAKCLVYVTYIVQLVNMILSALDAFTIYGYGFGDFGALVAINFAWFTSPIMSAIASLIVQSFYAFRFHTFSKLRLLPALIVVASLGVSISGFITGVYSFRAGNLTNLNTPRISIAVAVYLVGSAVIDLIIAICMTYTLMVNDTGFRRTHALVTKLIRLSIETGAVTAVMALITVILFFAFPEKGYYITPIHIMPMLYANTMFAVLNSRFNIVGGRSPYMTNSMDLNSTNLRDTGGNSNGAIVFHRDAFSAVDTTHSGMEMSTVNKRSEHTEA